MTGDITPGLLVLHGNRIETLVEVMPGLHAARAVRIVQQLAAKSAT
jgi:hypothetical protein